VRAPGGNEQNQIYRQDPGGKEPVLLTDPARTHRPIATNRARNRLLVVSTDLDKTGRRENPTLDPSLLDPLDPASVRKIATLPGTGWFAATFSFDDRQLALIEFKSVNETFVWVVDVNSGARRRVLPAATDATAKQIATENVEFTRDGKGLLVTTDRDGEFQRSAYLDFATGKLEYFGPDNWDTEELAVSPDGKTIAAVTNEAGVGVLRLYAADTRRELP